MFLKGKLKMLHSSIVSSLVIGGSGMIITYYYSRHSKQLAHDRLLKELFMDFNRRYDLLFVTLCEIEHKYRTPEQLCNAENAAQLRLSVIEYFNLCAEEYFWYHHKKRIDEVIWQSWSKGMLFWYNEVPTIKDIWDREIKQFGKESYYVTNEIGFFKSLK